MADSSTLIGLARVGRLDLLAMFPNPVYVTRTVWIEVAHDHNRPGAAALIDAEARGILRIVDAGDEFLYPELDAGESSTLSVASDMGAHVVVDERLARRRIQSDEALRSRIRSPLTTIGMVIRAKRLGLIPTIHPILDELRGESFWISQTDYESALRTAEEVP
ncbi:MAG: DUF3368 domain-containing protein [Chloroflexota bacterium]